MSNFTFIKPIDQPSGSFRLLDWLDTNFRDKNFTNFRCTVAFAKIKPFYKLHNSIQVWNSNGNYSEAIIGVDHKSTSLQALQYAMSNFNSVYILHVNYSTFHPKLYIFYGPRKAVAYYGSSNLTSGGLETNFEGGVLFDFDLTKDNTEFNNLLLNYTTLLNPSVPCTVLLTPTFLSQLESANLLLDESITPTKSPLIPSATKFSTTTKPLFGSYSVKPAKSIPKSVITAASSSGIIPSSAPKAKGRSTSPSTKALPSAPIIIPLLVDGFISQIAPHNNGEILLSKLAVNQNPAFFGFPFTGSTIPKKATNVAYPQRTPDPTINIEVYDSRGALVNFVPNYKLNMVYYTRKSEIRITITPSILAGLGWTLGNPNYPIMVMELSKATGIDYELKFYALGSIDYTNYLTICNQTLPSGGNSVPRKMGWY